MIKEGVIDSDKEVKVLFLIDDVSPLGTLCIDADGAMKPVLLPHSFEFLSMFRDACEVQYVLATACCENKKYRWFIDRDAIDEYLLHVNDYKNELFLDFEPQVATVKMSVPKEIRDI